MHSLMLQMNIMNNTLFERIVEIPISFGANKAKIITTDKIVLDKCFRDICASNACGMYGNCWMCPPSIGDISKLIQEVADYDYALVYQTISMLEDSYDFEGMMESKKLSITITQQIRNTFQKLCIPSYLTLGAGGCGVCNTCSKPEDKPCRFPNLAIPSLEAYGINVSHLANAAEMKYINGENTVTYFGAVLFNL